MARSGENQAEQNFPRLPDDVDFQMVDFVSSQHLKLKAYRFAPRDRFCQGVIFLCHGYAAHAKFEWLLPQTPGEAHMAWEGSVPHGLVSAGYIVHTLDQQSFGHSEGARGLRGFFEEFDDMPKENLEYLTAVAKKEPSTISSLPLFLFGVSMGGATAVRMAQMEPQMFRGMILYAPMLCLEEVKKQKVFACITNGHLASVAGCLSKALPTLPIAKPARNELFPLSQKEFDEEELNYHGDVRSRVGAEFMKVTEWFMNGGLESVSVPFAVFHAIHDTFVDPIGSQKLIDTAKSSDKQYFKVGTGQDVNVDVWHGLHFEPGHEAIFKHSLDWIVERTTPMVPA